MQNQALLQRSLAAVWHPCTQMKRHEKHLPLIPVSHARGAWLFDAESKRYLDGISSWWVNLFGHCHPSINAAIREQLETLEHVMLAGFTHEPVVQLSERLSALTEGQLGHSFYASDGASAIEIALKMSMHTWRNRGYPEKTEFITLAGAYHGETVGALAVTDVPLFRDAYAPLIRKAHTLPSPDARQAQAGENALTVAQQAAQALEFFLSTNAASIAALIVEPLVQGAVGMAMYDPEYLRLARKLCDRFNIHLICDEIAVGCGRTGTFFAYQQADITPDLLCLSKGLSGGYLPLSVVLSRHDIYAAFYSDETEKAFLHSHSYTGNPLACRAALATLDLFEQQPVLQRNEITGQQLEKKLATLRQHPRIRHFRRCGLIIAFDVVADAGFSQRFYRAALAHELLLRPIGNTVYLMPPYILNEDEIDHLARQTLAALETALL